MTNLNKTIKIGDKSMTKQELLNLLQSEFGPVVSRVQILEKVKEFNGIDCVGVRWILNNKKIRVGRASYNLVAFTSSGTLSASTVSGVGVVTE